MNVAMITSRERQLMAFQDSLEQRSARVEIFADGWSFLQAARSRTWNLVIVDALSLSNAVRGDLPAAPAKQADQHAEQGAASASPLAPAPKAGQARIRITPVTDLIEQMLEINASLNTAVITNLDAEEFHEATEGLGILAGLPANPDATEVDPLLEKLRAVGGLDPVVEAAQLSLDKLKYKHHPRCIVCWDRHPFGLKVDYRVTGEHTVEGTFGCGKFFEGYENILHGGIVSSLLDGAMASCILAKGLEAYTVDLRVRYRTAVATGVPATIRGEWLRGESPLHLLHATIEQNGKVCASARAKFFEGTPNQPSQPMPRSPGVRHLLSQARKRLR